MGTVDKVVSAASTSTGTAPPAPDAQPRIHIQVPQSLTATDAANDGVIHAPAHIDVPIKPATVLQRTEQIVQDANKTNIPRDVNATAVNVGSNSGMGILNTINAVVGRNPNLITDLHNGGTQAANAATSLTLDATRTVLPGVRHVAKGVGVLKNASAGARTQAATEAVAEIPKVAGALQDGSGSAASVLTQATEKIPEVTVAINTGGATTTTETAKAVASEAVEEAAGASTFLASTAGKLTLGGAGVALSAGASYYEYRAASNAGDGYRQAGAIGTLAGGVAGIAPGMMAGAATGAYIGTLVPVPFVGTAAGFLVGAVVGGIITYAGRKGGEALLGEKMQKDIDAKTKAEQDTEIGKLKTIEGKFAHVTDINTAQAEYQAAIKGSDINKIAKAKANLDVAAKEIAAFQGLSDDDKKNLAKLKDDLIKDYVNEKSLHIPDGDHAAKERQQRALASLGNAVGSIDAISKTDAQLKAQLTPRVRQDILQADTQLQAVADKRIVEIEKAQVAQAQNKFEHELALTIHPLLKYDKGSEAIGKINELDNKLATGAVTVEEGKKELAVLNAQQAKEQREIGRVQARLAEERKAEQLLLKDPHARKHAEANIKTIDALNADIESFKVNYKQVAQQSQQSLQIAETNADRGMGEDIAKPKPGSSVIGVEDAAGTMKTALNQVTAEGAASGLTDAKETTLAQGHNPVQEKTMLDRSAMLTASPARLAQT